jgi:hypothetical protein
MSLYTSGKFAPVPTTAVVGGKFAPGVNSKMPHNSIAGTPTSEGTPTSVVTLGAEGMLTTAGPEQQQKSQ